MPTPGVAGEPHPMAGWIRGMSLSQTWPEFFATSAFREAVDRVAETNANYIALIIPYEQATLNSTVLEPDFLTPEDWVLIEGIEYVHSRCMEVMLKPHVVVATGEWQANLEPSDRAEWFRNYGEVLKHYARIAEEHGVSLMALGAELNNMTNAHVHPDNTRHWRELISEIRDIYSGELTMSAQWGPSPRGPDNIEFLDDLDYIGIAAFYELNTRGTSVAELREAWDQWNRRLIGPLYERFQRPIIFGEVGYRSQEGARLEPWANRQTHSDEQEQANLYEALMSYWSEVDYFGGVFWWEWREDLPPDNTYYTPNDKQAEEVLTRWFGKGAGASAGEQPCP